MNYESIEISFTYCFLNAALVRTDLPIHPTKSARYSLKSKRTVNASRNLTNPVGL